MLQLTKTLPSWAQLLSVTKSTNIAIRQNKNVIKQMHSSNLTNKIILLHFCTIDHYKN